MYRIEFVETDNNKKPFKEFINALTLEEQADVFVAINKLCYLKNNALRISEKLSKSIRDGIYELRVLKYQEVFIFIILIKELFLLMDL